MVTGDEPVTLSLMESEQNRVELRRLEGPDSEAQRL
jgi:hypothetical protein